MQLFATYTFGQALLTVLEFALLVLWIWVAISVLTDVFRSHDMSGWAKAAWTLLILVVPVLGVLIYLIARGDKMRQHALVDRHEQEIAQLEDLRHRGVLDDAAFQRAKHKTMA